MTKLNTGSRLVKAPLRTEGKPSGKTHEGAPGFARDARTELFMRASTTFAGEGSFYESGEQADERAVELARELAVSDWQWLSQFLPWLRAQGNIRTSALMLAAQAADARTKAGITYGAGPAPVTGDLQPVLTTRQVVDAVCQRGDEPTEILQYCLKTFGRIPQPVKRGTADAMLRLWRERAVIRYDSPDRPLRFADAIELVHPSPRRVKAPDDLLSREKYQGWAPERAERDYVEGHREHLRDLFGFLLDERHHGADILGDAAREKGHTGNLPGIAARRRCSLLSPAERHAMAAGVLRDRESPDAREIRLAAAGQWEWVTSWLGEGAKDLKTALSERERWELVIPQMGYMALIRNLRNFDSAGIKDATAALVKEIIIDPQEVRGSRQLPFRFLSAYLNTHSVRWSEALETALSLSIRNIPVLSGNTLVMIDMSGSMQNQLSRPPGREGRRDKNKDTAVYPNRVMAAALFALALARANPGRVEVFGFADPPGTSTNWLGARHSSPGHFRLEGIEDPGYSLLRMAQNVVGKIGIVGHGTAIEQNLRQCFDSARHDRVVIFTDEQTLPGGPGWNGGWRHQIGDITTALPASTPVYAWNLAGNTFGAFATGGNRVALAGLTDASFAVMQRIEQGRSADWDAVFRSGNE